MSSRVGYTMGSRGVWAVVDDAPAAVALILMFNMTVPMRLWMGLRGHEASEVSEMVVAMVVIGVATVFMRGSRSSTARRSVASSAA